MNIPCPTHIPCLDPATPTANLSAEAPDVDGFNGFFTGDPSFPPPLGSNWIQNSCLGLCVSAVSQQDADACAYRASILCVTGSWGPPPDTGNNGGPSSGPPVIPPPNTPLPMFTNDAANCPVPCFFGGVVNLPISAGVIVAPSKAQANAIAQSLACRQASQLRVVGNTEQCATAQCPGGDPHTETRCTPPDTYGECLLAPTEAALAAAQEFYNDVARGAAQADANEALAEYGCQVCNTEATGFAACPGDPTKISHATVPAGTYCVPAGGDQFAMDAKATQDLYNQLQAGLQALGCACTSHVDTATQIITFDCDTFIQVINTVNGNAFACPLCGNPPGSGIFHILAGQTFDWNALWQAFIGGPTPSCRVIPVSFTAPEVKLKFN